MSTESLSKSRLYKNKSIPEIKPEVKIIVDDYKHWGSGLTVAESTNAFHDFLHPKMENRQR